MTKKTLSSLMIISFALATIGLTVVTDPGDSQIVNTMLQFVSTIGVIFIVLVIGLYVYSALLKK